ncbi:MAG: sulfite oxidase [Gemmatimonas sp. SG8_23]|jgi:DMSO/TMAO reductase YedYZ molybdopterin-dependent catalytic subunit|nr:MAG: sulfite oxidase [Gemmatimonas sp. SG8_23]
MSDPIDAVPLIDATTPTISRREAIRRGGAIAAAGAVFPSDLASHLARVAPQESVVPWTNAPAAGGRANTLDWQALASWVTPTEELFSVGHYGTPEVDAGTWRLEVGGLVERPRAYTLDQIRGRPRQSVTMLLECAGNRGFPTFMGAVHNATWTGTPLRPLLEEAGVRTGGIEVVFFGADQGTEEIRDVEVVQSFARSLSLEDATADDVLLAYEVNGEALPVGNGFPLRLIAPGWYGVANVKWLTRIEVRDTRFMGKFMARDYVTLRQEGPDEEAVWAETSVGRTNINSIPAKVVRRGEGYRIHGAAWGTEIARVEVRIDDGPWQGAVLGEGADDPHTWTFWHFDWEATTGDHTVTSRAIGADGEIQPAADDPALVQKITYWESNGQVTREITL